MTRRTKTDRIIGVQNILSELGHLEAQKFDGTLGRSTVVAIKAFQKANGLPETGALTDELAKKYGPQFEVPKLLRDNAAKGEGFYDNYHPAKAA